MKPKLSLVPETGITGIEEGQESWEARWGQRLEEAGITMEQLQLIEEPVRELLQRAGGCDESS